MKTVVGLTGTTGSGKSTVSKHFAYSGFFVLNCDLIAKDVVENNKIVLDKLCECFGNDIIKGNRLDRRLLADRAFADKASTDALNAITLPPIVEEITAKINSSCFDYILLDAPTLFESGADKLCDITVAVISDYEKRIERIIKRDSITPEQAKLRISAQNSNDFFIKNCTYIIENNSDILELKQQADYIIGKIMKG